jgi:hypothetical protein
MGEKKKPKAERKTDKPAVPIKYNYVIEDVMALRDALASALKVGFLNERPAGERWDRLVDVVLEVLPEGVTRPVLEDSLRHLAGRPLTEEVIRAEAWRVAGNVPRMRHRRAVPPWHVQRIPEWVPLQITACRRVRDYRGRLAAAFSARVLAGTPAGLMVLKTWTLKLCRFYATDFGFGRPGTPTADRFPYQAPEQLVNFRLFGLISPVLSEDGPVFDSIGFLAPQRAWNKALIKMRQRVVVEQCPAGFPPDLACHKCPVGYQRCTMATHRETWVRGRCPKCNDDNAVFDPELKLPHCIDCEVRSVYKGDKE